MEMQELAHSRRIATWLAVVVEVVVVVAVDEVDGVTKSNSLDLVGSA